MTSINMMEAEEELESWSSNALNEAFEARPSPQFRGHQCYLVHRTKGIVSLDISSDSIKSKPQETAKRPDVMDDPITSFCVDNSIDNEVHVVTAHKSSLLRTWMTDELTFRSSYKSTHKGPILMMAMSIEKDLLVTLSVERSVTATFWAIRKPLCLKTFKGVVPTQATSMSILPTGSVAIGSVEGSIAFIKYTGDENQRFNDTPTLLKKHVSAVTMTLDTGSNRMISGGKDAVLVLWDTLNNVALKVLPVYEEILSAVFVSNKNNIVADMDNDTNLVLTGGSKGTLRLFDVQSGVLNEVSLEEEERKGNKFLKDVFDPMPISYLHKINDNQVAVLQDDLLLQLDFEEKKTRTLRSFNWSPMRQMDVLQLNMVVVSVMDSSLLRLVDVQSGQLVKVHKTSHPEVLILSAAGDMGSTTTTKGSKTKLATYGTDNEIRVWQVSKKRLIALTSLSNQQHIGMMALSETHLVTLTNEGVLASRRLVSDEGSFHLASPKSVLSHTDRVNIMDVHNDMVATGSQDGTAKVFNIDSLDVVSVLSGHRRGVERIAFSTFDDDLVITGSGDGRLRVWSVPGFVCQNTFDHVFGVNSDNYVFVRDKRLVVADDQGAFAVWDLKNNNEPSVCTKGHGPSSYSSSSSLSFMANVADDKLITGGSDNELRLWSSNETLIEQLNNEKRQRRTLEEQKLINLSVKGDIKNAALLAVKMGKVRTAFDLLSKAHQQNNLEETLQAMEGSELQRLAQCSVQWNANTKFYELAQLIVRFCLEQSDEDVFDKSDLVKLISYNERHLERLNRLDARLSVLDCLIGQM